MNNYYEQAIQANQRQQELHQEAEKSRLSGEITQTQKTTIKRQFRRVMTATGTVLIVAGQRIQTGDARKPVLQAQAQDS